MKSMHPCKSYRAETSINTTTKTMHPYKSYRADTNINTTTKTKSKKGHNSAKIMRMITGIKPDLYRIMIYPSANFQHNQCIPAKVIEQKPISTQQQKGHNLAKILQKITNIKLDLYFTMIYPSASFQWYQCIPAKVIEQKPISTQLQKLCQNGP